MILILVCEPIVPSYRAMNDFDFDIFTKQRVMRNRVNTRGIEPMHATTSDKLWGMVSHSGVISSFSYLSLLTCEFVRVP